MPTIDNDGVPERKESGRVEAFSDGVFAIAITLLILEIQVPHADESADLLGQLVALWPSYFAFLTSFATIGIMWINHHKMFTHIVLVDQTLLVLNGLLLLGITFVPFPTAVLAEHILHPGQTVAALFYSGTFFVIAVFFNVLWRYAAAGHRLVGSRADLGAITAITRQYRFGPLLYLAAFGLAFVSVPASLALNLLLALFFAAPPRRLGA